MSGKGLLLQLLNASDEIAIFPYHKFGISCNYLQFKELVKIKRYKYDEKYFNYSENNKIKIKFYDENKIFFLNLSQLIYFIINNTGSMPYLFESHITKKTIAFAGDEYTEFVNFNFNIYDFINKIEKNIFNSNIKIFDIEDLDNIIFNSFIQSTAEYSTNYSKYNYYAQWTSNKYEEISFLLENYKDIKLIFLNRDIISSSFSIAKRILSKHKNKVLIKDYKKMIIEVIHNRKKNEKLFHNVLKKFENKKNCIIINFNDLINNREVTINKICQFIGVKYNTSMLNSYFIDQKIDNSNFNNIMNDDPNEIFSLNEIKKLQKLSQSNLRLYLYNKLNKIFKTYI